MPKQSIFGKTRILNFLKDPQSTNWLISKFRFFNQSIQRQEFELFQLGVNTLCKWDSEPEHQRTFLWKKSNKLNEFRTKDPERFVRSWVGISRRGQSQSRWRWGCRSTAVTADANADNPITPLSFVSLKLANDQWPKSFTVVIATGPRLMKPPALNSHGFSSKRWTRDKTKKASSLVGFWTEKPRLQVRSISL